MPIVLAPLPIGYGPSMATGIETTKTVAIAPLNGSNYPTWKVQCRMALVREGQWGIIAGTATAPEGEGADPWKFLARRERALATFFSLVPFFGSGFLSLLVCSGQFRRMCPNF